MELLSCVLPTFPNHLFMIEAKHFPCAVSSKDELVKCLLATEVSGTPFTTEFSVHLHMFYYRFRICSWYCPFLLLLSISLAIIFSEAHESPVLMLQWSLTFRELPGLLNVPKTWILAIHTCFSFSFLKPITIALHISKCALTMLQRFAVFWPDSLNQAGTKRDKATVDGTTNRINSLLFKVYIWAQFLHIKIFVYANYISVCCFQVRSIRMSGSCAMNLCGIACGRLDIMYELGYGGPW